MGHPEHPLLFIATQVARAAGLKDPKWSTQNHKKAAGTLRGRDVEVMAGNLPTLAPLRNVGTRWRDAWLFPESVVYQMLLRGHAPASEPFRKWVTGVVLPSIRKTGKFDVNEAQDQTSQDFAGQFAKTLDLIRSSPMMAPLSPAPLVRAPRPKATGSPT
ncbi:Bro-N domain-containing protein [Pseudomonas sp. SCT]|uniref:BRO-N domain-containing protein n=1 Tax=Pseudomonas sp. (strain SCT) TaxID=412955 RepID=UPI0035D01B92